MPDKNKYKDGYGCAMLYFKFDELKQIQKLIDKDDIYTAEPGYGLENETHITLLYGFHYKDIKSDDEIFDNILKNDIPNLELYNVSIFENEKYDVLKFDVRQKMGLYKKSKDVLYIINKDLSDKFPFTTNFPDYHPHSTIAYLKPKTGKKYVKEFKDKEYIVTPEKIVYSIPDPNDKNEHIKKSKKINKPIMEKLVFEHKLIDFNQFSKLMENTEIRFDETNFDLKDFIKSIEDMSTPSQIDAPDTASTNATNRKLDDVIIDDLEHVQKSGGDANKTATATSSTPATPASSDDKPKGSSEASAQKEVETKEGSAKESVKKQDTEEKPGSAKASKEASDKASEEAQAQAEPKDDDKEKKFNFQK